jgi:hypothetical protein
LCALVQLCCADVAGAQAGLARRQPETGREWLARCGALLTGDAPVTGQRFQGAACVAWVEGLVDINEIYRGLGALEKTTEGFCTPSSATIEQAASAVARYLEEHPAVLHFSARILAYVALREAFPCTGRQ